MFASKATSAKVSLKVTFRDDIPAGGLLFTFTSAQAGEDRTAVQDTLIPYITANRSAPNGVTPAAPAAPSPVAGPSGEKKRKAMDPATPTDTAPGTPSAVAGGVRRPQTQLGKIRLRVLRKNPTLKMLHTELVLAKEITEEEFWDGREVSYISRRVLQADDQALLQAEALAYEQKPGRASRLLDDRFDLDSGRKGGMAAGGTGVGVKSKADSGPVVLNISKELTREIFEEFPVVQDAYARSVPGVSEQLGGRLMIDK
jgi:transcription initiation factor TFIIH subunit 1